MSNSNQSSIHLNAIVPAALGGQRLDQIAAQLFAEYSRARLTQFIKSGALTVNNCLLRPRDLVHAGAQLSLTATLVPQGDWVPEQIDFKIMYEDEHLLVLDKPAGLVVHPAAGHAAGTLLNALLHHLPENAAIPRAGIVHRLDKDTTGLMVVAKTLQAQTALVAQLQERSVTRIYECIVHGVLATGATINTQIGRSGTHRQRMAVTDNGKPAVTHYRVLERYRAHSYVRVKLETGRTHQIRVHMTHAGFPLVGDPVYGGRSRIPPAANPSLVETLKTFPRQALHARALKLNHPITGARLQWQSALPDDLTWLRSLLRQDRESFIG